ncbi:MAG: thiosulfate oxidation carrier protein SoxY [Pseudomonadota bacterium]
MHLLQTRRHFLQASVPVGLVSVAAAAGLLRPTAAFAWFPFFNVQPPQPPAAAPAPAPFKPIPSKPQIKSPLGILIDELRHAQPELSPAVDLMSPEIAVDGASIMLEFQALLPDVDGFAVYIEGNPRPLAGAFYLAPNVLPEMKLLVRLARSSNVSVVARSQGRFYKAVKFVKVTQGGCSDSFAETESRHRQEVQRGFKPGSY